MLSLSRSEWPGFDLWSVGRYVSVRKITSLRPVVEWSVSTDRYDSYIRNF